MTLASLFDMCVSDLENIGVKSKADNFLRVSSAVGSRSALASFVGAFVLI